MADVNITQNDTFPPINATLTKTIDGTTTPVDLTGSTVTLRMRSDTTVISTGPVTIVSATAGTVTYPWLATDTASPGTYNAEWLVTTSTGRKFTVPNTGAFTILVESSL